MKFNNVILWGVYIISLIISFIVFYPLFKFSQALNISTALLISSIFAISICFIAVSFLSYTKSDMDDHSFMYLTQLSILVPVIATVTIIVSAISSCASILRCIESY